MASARLALKNLGQKLVSPSAWPVSQSCGERSLMSSVAQKQRWGPEALFVRRLTTAAGDDRQEKSEGRQVAVSSDKEEEGGKKFKLFPRRHRKKGSLWRNNTPTSDLVPSFHEILPSGLGSALWQATENINRLFEKLSPSRLIGRVKEQDECYKLRFDVPGLKKEEVNITVADGVLRIKGEHQEEDDGEDEFWYGYYDTTLLLPEDAKTDEIKAEMKDGVLTIIIPRAETPKKDVKEVEIQ